MAALLGIMQNLIPTVQASEMGKMRKKIVIAHRGASGYLPEHTLEAVSMAYAMGADFIEQDLVLTKDGVPVVLHDIYLDTTTNVCEKFPDRTRSDGRWYVIDFTLEEIKTLKVHERTSVCSDSAVFPKRFPVGKADFEVPTFAEEIEIVQGLNKSIGRDVGIYPELKEPAFHTQEGYDMGKIVLQILASYGYEGTDANIYVQSFDPQYLKRLRIELGTELPLIQLIGARISHNYLVTPQALDDIATYANGIGPSTERIIQPGKERPLITNLVNEAHARSLVVHPYTFRKDLLPEYADNLEELGRLFFFVIGVDGVFTDFPDEVVKLLSALEY
jgi:glycerophosphoryl diester phosphodiesterase